MTWLADMGLYDAPVAEYPGGRAAREKTNHYVTGRDGGRDIDLRAFAAEGMRLYGMLDGLARGTDLRFLPTLTAALDDADARLQLDLPRHRRAASSARASTRRQASPYAAGLGRRDEEPDLARPRRRAAITTIVWAIGYRPDYRWVQVGVFDGSRAPDPHPRRHRRPTGLYFLGLPVAAHLGLGPLPRHRRGRRARGRRDHRELAAVRGWRPALEAG